MANPTPDLKIVSVEAPANILSGQVLDVTWTVQNNGDATGNIGWDDAVYLSFDQVFDPANDAYLGFHRHTGGLLAGQNLYQEWSRFQFRLVWLATSMCLLSQVLAGR